MFLFLGLGYLTQDELGFWFLCLFICLFFPMKFTCFLGAFLFSFVLLLHFYFDFLWKWELFFFFFLREGEQKERDGCSNREGKAWSKYIDFLIKKCTHKKRRCSEDYPLVNIFSSMVILGLCQVDTNHLITDPNNKVTLN